MLTVHEHFSFFPSLVSKFDISHSYAFVKTNNEVLDYLLSDPKGLRVPLLHGDAKRTYDLEILENDVSDLFNEGELINFEILKKNKNGKQEKLFIVL